VEVVRRVYDGFDADGRREHLRKGMAQFVERFFSIPIGMKDLSQGVYAGVGPAGGLNANVLTGDGGKSVFDVALNGGTSGLNLPAGIVGAVVAHDGFEALSHSRMVTTWWVAGLLRSMKLDIKLELPKELADALADLFARLPMDDAMGRLVGPEDVDDDVVLLIEAAAKNPVITAELVAGLWLYAGNLDRSHKISQGIQTATGSFWHGIMHRREGDFGNSHYWFRNAGSHPAMADIPDYDPHRFIEEIQEGHRGNPDELVDVQRGEWAALFSWCARADRD